MKKHTKDSITRKLQKIWKDYDFSEINYCGYDEKIEVICPKHGLFTKTPKQLSLGKGCPKCAYNTKTEKEIIKELKTIHNNKFRYELNEYKNLDSIINVYCEKHGQFESTIKNHMKWGCKKCSNKYLDKDLFIEKSINIHRYLYDYSKVVYKNNKTDVVIICKKHGEFKQLPNDHLSGHGCPICKNSLGEMKIWNYLTKKNIKFESQKKFNGCKNKRLLPFDFYLPEYNICIEYDGIQHYKAIDIFGGEKEFQKRI